MIHSYAVDQRSRDRYPEETKWARVDDCQVLESVRDPLHGSIIEGIRLLWCPDYCGMIHLTLNC
jgi:hypothetical protein